MVNNLDGKLENSKIPAVVASDVNDDEVEIDFDSGIITNKTKGESYKGQAIPEFMQKIIAADGSVDRWMWCRSIYAVYDDTNL